MKKYRLFTYSLDPSATRKNYPNRLIGPIYDLETEKKNKRTNLKKTSPNSLENGIP